MTIDFSHAGAWIAIVTFIGGVIVWIVNMTVRFRRLERRSDYRKDDTEILTRAMFACLDGLGQIGANGPVTKMRKEREEYIIKIR